MKERVLATLAIVLLVRLEVVDVCKLAEPNVFVELLKIPLRVPLVVVVALNRLALLTLALLVDVALNVPPLVVLLAAALNRLVLLRVGALVVVPLKVALAPSVLLAVPFREELSRLVALRSGAIVAEALNEPVPLNAASSVVFTAELSRLVPVRSVVIVAEALNDDASIGTPPSVPPPSAIRASPPAVISALAVASIA